MEDMEYEIGIDCFNKNQNNEAIKFLLGPAQNGNLAAMNNLGICYERIGEYTKAAFWFSSAGMCDYVYSNINLANLYMTGKGLEQNKNIAISLYEKCMELGDLEAYIELGYYYYEGKYLDQDYKKAYQYFLKGADIERRDKKGGFCLCQLGYMNHEGCGRKKNDKIAFKYYLESAKLGDKTGQYNLGQCYLFGHGCDENVKNALYWFLESARQDYSDALIKLGELYAYGTVVEKSKDISLYWLNKAIDNNVPEAFVKCASFYLYDGIYERNNLEAYKLLAYFAKYLYGQSSSADSLYDELKTTFANEKFWKKIENNNKGVVA